MRGERQQDVVKCEGRPRRALRTKVSRVAAYRWPFPHGLPSIARGGQSSQYASSGGRAQWNAEPTPVLLQRSPFLSQSHDKKTPSRVVSFPERSHAVCDDTKEIHWFPLKSDNVGGQWPGRCANQSVVYRPAASQSPGLFSEMQILGLQPKSTTLESAASQDSGSFLCTSNQGTQTLSFYITPHRQASRVWLQTHLP